MPMTIHNRRYAVKSDMEQRLIAQTCRVLGEERVNEVIRLQLEQHRQATPEETVDLMTLEFGFRGIGLETSDPDRAEFYALGRALREVYSDTFKQSV